MKKTSENDEKILEKIHKNKMIKLEKYTFTTR